MGDRSIGLASTDVHAECGKVVIETPGGVRRVASAQSALQLAGELIETAAVAAGQRSGVRRRRAQDAA